MYLVCKPTVSLGVQLYSGEIVDASKWKNLKLMLAYRYIEPYVGDVEVCKVCARKFSTKEVLQHHQTVDNCKLEVTEPSTSKVTELPTPPAPVPPQPEAAPPPAQGGAATQAATRPKVPADVKSTQVSQSVKSVQAPKQDN
jgi:hypothetical protein